MKLERHSPSSLNLFAASPAMWVLERVLGKRQPVGAPAHRGVAVEEGVAHGLKNPTADPQEAINVALRKFDSITALSGDPRKAKYRATIEVMVLRALKELIPYGIPSATQRYVEWRPDGLKCPIVGYLDFAWDDHGVLTDLKTTERMPEHIKIAHARQVALYASSDNMQARVTYVTPTKTATYAAENIRAHREALFKMALTVERFVGLTSDPQELVGLVVPDLESFYWNTPEARQEAFNVWGV
jgi:hypothetical protein